MTKPIAALRILFGSRKRLLESSDLASLFILARQFRAICAICCVTSFVVALTIVLGYRALPFEIVPTSMALLLAVFVISAALASRFGRLGSVELHPVYRKRAGHLIEIDTHCAEYAKRIDRQGRPLTRLDLEELGAIYLKSKREHEQMR